ncbi:MAG: SDR family oxidoreductase [Candidatus Marinimicrobia bacterium]|nr:SDR family oxidoreductase [Candidatus Neomarinimicrobiota bacterium]
MMDFTDQVALITGGSRGIGAACARQFAEAGAHVGLVYRSHDEEAREVQAAVEALGRKALLLQGDVASLDTARDHVQQVAAAFGRLDVLVNNAGIWTALTTGEGDEVEWDRTMAVNLKSVFNYSDSAVPMMRSAGRGAIIHVSSTAGQRGEAGHSHYAATKGGIIAYTKSLAVELAPEIRVNAVAPGWVDTPMNAGTFADAGFLAEVTATIPLGRIPPPEDIAGPILFLASDLARHITGEILNVNGGAVLSG